MNNRMDGMSDEQARDWALITCLGSPITQVYDVEFERAEKLLGPLAQVFRTPPLPMGEGDLRVLKLTASGKAAALEVLKQAPSEYEREDERLKNRVRLQGNHTAYRYKGWEVDRELTDLLRAASDVTFP